MAPRWSGNRSSGVASPTYTTVAIAALITLVVGAAAGYFIGGQQASSGEARVARSAIAESSVDGMKTAEPNEPGAVKAATSFIVGLPALAGEPPSSRQNTINDLVADSAPESVTKVLEGTLFNVQRSLFGTALTTDSRVVVSPTSYKSRVNADKSVTVTVWYVTVLWDPTAQNFRSSWTTTELQLVRGEGWEIQGLTSSIGPTPALLSAEAKASTIDEARPAFDFAYPYRYALAP